jgi:hypothetical protein
MTRLVDPREVFTAYFWCSDCALNLGLQVYQKGRFLRLFFTKLLGSALFLLQQGAQDFLEEWAS